MNYKKLLEDCDFIKVKQTVEIRPHDENKGFYEYVNHVFKSVNNGHRYGPAVKTNILTMYNRGNYVACEMGDQRIDIRRDKIIIYVPGLKASNEETYRQYAINNIGVLNYIYNCKKY